MTARQIRHAYTLLEMTVVTAVITIAATLIVPSLEGMYGYYKKNAAIDAVKAAWAQARSRAIDEGRPYRFTAQPGSGSFRVAPDEAASGSNTAAQAPAIEGSLPEGVAFTATATADDPDEPIVFLPDGTARDDAQVVFQVQGARATALHLRALTGAVSVGAADAQGGH
jgi:prepilin-type N-terminal cleavage/methylation domain-containing protein